jgi:hypothetical protein
VDTTRLQSRLIGEHRSVKTQTSILTMDLDVSVYTLSAEPTMSSSTSVEETFIQTLHILPNLPLKTLRLKILKTLKAKPSAKIRIYARLRRDETSVGVWGEIDLASSRQSDLTWWGVENGGDLGVVLS